MKIIEIIPSFIPLGGAENFVLSLSLFLNNACNCDVTLISLYNYNNAYINDFLLKNKFKIYFLNKRKGIDFRCSLKLKKIIKQLKPDICHLHLGSFLTFFLSRCFKKQKNFYTFHTFIDKSTYGFAKAPFSFILIKLIKKGYIKPVFISSKVFLSFSNYFFNCDPNIINNGVDTSVFKPQNDLFHKKFTFISVGRFCEVKNHLLMINAFRLVQEKYNNVSLVMLGDGPLLKTCKRICVENDINSILFLGHIDNVYSYLSDSKCFLLSSNNEGNPLVINEAISSGIWVISTNVGGVSDILNDTCGYLVEPKNIDAFSNAMISFIENEKNIMNTISKNLDFNRKRVDIKNTARLYESLFRNNL